MEGDPSSTSDVMSALHITLAAVDSHTQAVTHSATLPPTSPQGQASRPFFLHFLDHIDMLGLFQKRAHSLGSRKVCPARHIRPLRCGLLHLITSDYKQQVAPSSVSLPSPAAPGGHTQRNVAVRDTAGWAGGNSTEKTMFGDVSLLGQLGQYGATHCMVLSDSSPMLPCMRYPIMYVHDMGTISSSRHEPRPGSNPEGLSPRCPAVAMLHHERDHL